MSSSSVAGLNTLELWLNFKPVLREMRYFSPWLEGLCQDFILPKFMQDRQGSELVPIGDMVLSTADVWTITAT